MPLVDYGTSDESESDENTDKIEKITDKKKQDYNKSENQNPKVDHAHIVLGNEIEPDSVDDVENSLFSKLPTPKTTFSIPDNTFKLLNKKTQPVKIVLPSLNEINKSLDGDEVKKPKPSSKGSGLFALLPAPKHSKSLIPDIVKKNKVPVRAITKPPIKPKYINPISSSIKKTKALNEEDEDNDESGEQPESFFFSSADVKPEEIEPIDIPELPPSSVAHSSSVISSAEARKSSIDGNLHETTYPENNPCHSTDSEDNSMEISDFNKEAFEKLCGAGARKRKGDVPEEIIDINIDSMVGDAYMWLSKDLTKEHEHSGFKKPKNLSVVERRKHQITYLASQAKEKEMELRNQWANSRMTRKQTQSKYGF